MKIKKHAEILDLRKKLNNKLIINKHDRAVIIDVSDILYMVAEGPYTEFVMANGARVKSSKNLGYYIKLLADKYFLQKVNRSYVINFEHLMEIQKDSNGNGMLLLSNSESIPFSNYLKNKLIQKIQEILSESIRG